MRGIGILFLAFALSASGCAGAKHPALIQYESAVAQAEERAAQGEISAIESENLKLQAHQRYLEVRRREEKQFDDDFARQIKSQNQDVNAVSRLVQ